MLRVCALGLVTLLLPRPSSGGGIAGRDEAVAAATYLSKDAFPGFHLLERVGDGTMLRIYRQCQRPPEQRPPLELDTATWGSMEEARRSLSEVLDIAEPEPLQLPWAVFDAQGLRLSDFESLRGLSLAFLVVIGQWMWPAVRVGFEQRVEGVKGEQAAVLRTLSVRPVIFEVRDFLSQVEAEEVMLLGQEQGLERSEGSMQSADIAKGTSHDDFRTSRQAWLDNDAAPVVAALDKRTAQLTRVHASHNEPVQLLRYDGGEYYQGHMDWTELELYPDQRDIWMDSHFGHQDRMATVFWYLNDVSVGGETIFPKHGQPICFPDSLGGIGTDDCPGSWEPDMDSCEVGLKITPRLGTVILWYNYHASGRGDRNALHAGCPVGKGITKWSANKWVSIKPLRTRGKWIDDHPALKRFGWQPGGSGEACNADSLNRDTPSS